MDFRPIRTKKIYEVIIEQIKTLILEGKLRPGDRLMSEREMAEKMQVGRSAVREAFRALEAMRIVEIKPGEGTYIREANTDYIIESLALVLQSEDQATQELMELRRILEEECAALAASRHTEGDLIAMRKYLAELDTASQRGEIGYESDLGFHYSIYKATGNAIIFRLMATLRDTVRHALYEVLDELVSSNSATPRQLYQEHVQIYQAIASGDAEAARLAMRSHLNTALKGVLNQK